MLGIGQASNCLGVKDALGPRTTTSHDRLGRFVSRFSYAFDGGALTATTAAEDVAGGP